MERQREYNDGRRNQAHISEGKKTPSGKGARFATKVGVDAIRSTYGAIAGVPTRNQHQ